MASQSIIIARGGPLPVALDGVSLQMENAAAREGLDKVFLSVPNQADKQLIDEWMDPKYTNRPKFVTAWQELADAEHQGIAIISQDSQGRRHLEGWAIYDDVPVFGLYLSYLEIAPWNRDKAGDRRIKGVGTLLVAKVMDEAFKRGYGGKVYAHTGSIDSINLFTSLGAVENLYKGKKDELFIFRRFQSSISSSIIRSQNERGGNIEVDDLTGPLKIIQGKDRNESIHPSREQDPEEIVDQAIRQLGNFDRQERANASAEMEVLVRKTMSAEGILDRLIDNLIDPKSPVGQDGDPERFRRNARVATLFAIKDFVRDREGLRAIIAKRLKEDVVSFKADEQRSMQGLRHELAQGDNLLFNFWCITHVVNSPYWWVADLKKFIYPDQGQQDAVSHVLYHSSIFDYKESLLASSAAMFAPAFDRASPADLRLMFANVKDGPFNAKVIQQPNGQWVSLMKNFDAPYSGTMYSNENGIPTIKVLRFDEQGQRIEEHAVDLRAENPLGKSLGVELLALVRPLWKVEEISGYVRNIFDDIYLGGELGVEGNSRRTGAHRLENLYRHINQAIGAPQSDTFSLPTNDLRVLDVGSSSGRLPLILAKALENKDATVISSDNELDLYLVRQGKDIAVFDKQGVVISSNLEKLSPRLALLKSLFDAGQAVPFSRVDPEVEEYAATNPTRFKHLALDIFGDITGHENKYDLVCNMNLLQNITEEDRARIMPQLARMVRDKGYVVIGFSQERAPEVYILYRREGDKLKEVYYTGVNATLGDFRPSLFAQLDQEYDLGNTTQVSALVPDQKPTRNLGGIDMNSDSLELSIKRDTQGMPLPAVLQNWAQISINGLEPVFVKMEPVNLPELIGTP